MEWLLKFLIDNGISDLFKHDEDFKLFKSNNIELRYVNSHVYKINMRLLGNWVQGKISNYNANKVQVVFYDDADYIIDDFAIDFSDRPDNRILKAFGVRCLFKVEPSE